MHTFEFFKWYHICLVSEDLITEAGGHEVNMVLFIDGQQVNTGIARSIFCRHNFIYILAKLQLKSRLDRKKNFYHYIEADFLSLAKNKTP